MSLWRRTAIERMPALGKVIAAARGPYALWIDLRCEMDYIYEREPLDDALIAAVYGYANWCLTESRNDELMTAALVCFYEHLPTDPLKRADVGRWLSVEQFHDLRGTFLYHLSEKELDGFAREFLAQKNIRPNGSRVVRLTGRKGAAGRK